MDIKRSLPSFLVLLAGSCPLVAQAAPVPPGAWSAPFDHGKCLTTKTNPYPSCTVRRVAYDGDPILPSAAIPMDCLKPDPPKRMLAASSNAVFLALHMSLIPRGPDQGKVLIWGHQHYPNGSPGAETRPTYWSVFDPETGIFNNFCAPYAREEGDLFCAGHSWTAEGDLLVAGGTTAHGNDPAGGNGWVGSKVTYLYRTDIDLNNAETQAIRTTEIVPPGTTPGMNQVESPWEKGPELSTTRWYPSLTTLATHPQLGQGIIVAGGTNNGNGVPSYQVWLPGPSATGSWLQVSGVDTFHEPPGGSQFSFGNYPRMSVMSTGMVATAGMKRGSDRIDPYNPSLTAPFGWLNDPGWLQAAQERIYGSSLLFPMGPAAEVVDLLISIGGASGSTVYDTVEGCFASADQPNHRWDVSFPPLNHRRMLFNSVLLPDETILVLGGRKNHHLQGGGDQKYNCTREAAFIPEQYIGVWRELRDNSIIRDYHSTALLLPDGRVLQGGGESRAWLEDDDCVANQPSGDPYGRTRQIGPVDYQYFLPPYLDSQIARPRITNAAPHGQALQWPAGGTYVIQYEDLPLDASISRVVVMWPGSVTHHSDGNQRCVSLEFDVVVPFPPNGNGTVYVDIPQTPGLLPRGYYMIFLVTSQGTVCQKAAWVKIV